MNVMPSLIAVVAFIVTTALCADVNEYSDDAIARFSTIKTGSFNYPSKLTTANPAIAIPFQRGEHPMYDGLILYPEVWPLLNEQVCKDFFGIQFTTGGTFCNVTLFGLWVRDYEKEDDSLEFFLEMESDFTPPFRVEIPVFKLPASLKTKSQAEIKRWAAIKKVALVSPLTDVDIQSIRLTKKIWLKFNWLTELLKFGLFDSDECLYSERHETDFQVYVSRPIVLHADTVQKLIDVTNTNDDNNNNNNHH